MGVWWWEYETSTEEGWSEGERAIVKGGAVKKWRNRSLIHET